MVKQVFTFSEKISFMELKMIDWTQDCGSLVRFTRILTQRGASQIITHCWSGQQVQQIDF